MHLRKTHICDVRQYAYNYMASIMFCLMCYKQSLYLIYLGSRDDTKAKLLYDLFHRDNFRISITKDAATVEVCGAIKVTSHK